MSWATRTCRISVGHSVNGPGNRLLSSGKMDRIRRRRLGPDLWRLVLWSLVAGWCQSFFSDKQLASLRHLFQRKTLAPPHALLTPEKAYLELIDCFLRSSFFCCCLSPTMP